MSSFFNARRAARRVSGAESDGRWNAIDCGKGRAIIRWRIGAVVENCDQGHREFKVIAEVEVACFQLLKDTGARD